MARRLRLSSSGPPVLKSDGSEPDPGNVATAGPDGIPVWEPPSGGVSTVFGRSGNIVAETDDYQASEIGNDSSVTGTHVSDALNTLAASVTLSVNIDIATPALVAGVMGYVDVDLSTSGLQPLATNDPIHMAPQADLVPGGATQGYYIGARISAANTARLTFVGTLPGGVVAFTATRL